MIMAQLDTILEEGLMERLMAYEFISLNSPI